jgi:hypothetical protein
MFLLAENPFVPLLFPPETDTLSADSVKEDLKIKVKASLAKVAMESIPQTLC